MGECVLGVDEVGGSNPPASTKSFIVPQKREPKPDRTHSGVLVAMNKEPRVSKAGERRGPESVSASRPEA